MLIIAVIIYRETNSVRTHNHVESSEIFYIESSNMLGVKKCVTPVKKKLKASGKNLTAHIGLRIL